MKDESSGKRRKETQKSSSLSFPISDVGSGAVSRLNARVAEIREEHEHRVRGFSLEGLKCRILGA